MAVNEYSLYGSMIVTINGTQAQLQLQEFANRIANMKSLYSDLSRYMYSSVMQNFNSRGRPYKWQALKPQTVERKRRAGSTRPNVPLYRTGKMKHGIKASHNKHEARVSVNEDYAIYHHGKVNDKYNPASKATKYMPQRRFMLFQEEDQAYIEMKTLGHIVGNLR